MAAENGINVIFGSIRKVIYVQDILENMDETIRERLMSPLAGYTWRYKDGLMSWYNQFPRSASTSRFIEKPPRAFQPFGFFEVSSCGCPVFFLSLA
jgi:hypothetical protein